MMDSSVLLSAMCSFCIIVVFLIFRLERSKAIFFAFLSTLSTVGVLAQVPDISGPNAPPIPNVGHHYLGLSQDLVTETVNPSDGSVSVHINIPTPPSRGFTFPFALTYSSSGVYQFNGYAVPPSFAGMTLGANVDTGVGWGYSFPELTAMSEIATGSNFASGYDGGQPTENYSCDFMSNYVFQGIDGSRHLLAISPSEIYQNNPYCSLTTPMPQNITSGGDDDYYATTSTLWGEGGVNSTLVATPNPVFVYGRDGMAYTFNNFYLSNNVPGSGGGPAGAYYSFPSSIEDRNGNIAYLSYTPGDVLGHTAYAGGVVYTDTAGRTAFSLSPVAPNTLTASLSVAGISNPITIQWELTPVLSMQSSGMAAPTLFVIKSITLPGEPSPLTYSFSYDQTYGLLQKITFPSGAYINYTWGSNTASEAAYYYVFGGVYSINPLCPNASTTSSGAVLYNTPAIVARDISYDGANIAEHQTFQYSTSWPTNATYNPNTVWTTKQTIVDSIDELGGSDHTKTTYSYVPKVASWINPNSVIVTPSCNAVAPPPPYTPVESTVVYQDVAKGQTQKSITKNWMDQYLESCEVTTLPDTSQSTATFNSYGIDVAAQKSSGYTSAIFQLTDKKEYDYDLVGPGSCYSSSGNVSGSAPASPASTRETAIQYNNMTQLPNGGFLADAVSRVQVYGQPIGQVNGQTGGSSALLTETDISYDGTSLQPVSVNTSTVGTQTLPSHDEKGYGVSQVTGRGNPTTVTKLCLQGCSNSTVTAQYDETGQRIAFTAPDGNATGANAASYTTHLYYSDNYVDSNPNGNSNTFLTKVQRPSVNNVAHISSYQYNYALGKLVLATDENLQQSTYGYGDPLGRVTNITAPDGGSTSIAYYDAGTEPTITTSQLLNLQTGAKKVVVTTQDGMGHPISVKDNDPDGAVETDTQYDGFGRVFTQSNQYRSASDPTYGLAVMYYDALGRLTKRTNPDKSYVTYGYVGNNTTYTDENRNQWSRTSNAFGYLLQVLEPTGISQTPILPTNYGYDALGNLLSVNQVGSGSTTDGPSRNRSFAYDSLGRLIAALNPEALVAGIAGPSCAGTSGSWSNCYSYDPSGNLTSKTDARGVITNYAFDQLNRLYAKTYTNALVGTLSSCYQFDAAINGVDRLAAEWTQTGGCSSMPPANYQSKRTYGAYDVVGRVVSEQQCVAGYCTSPSVPIQPPANCPSLTSPAGMQYCYDQAGNLLAYSNGYMAGNSFPQQAILFSQAFDNVGRLRSVTSSWNDSTHPPALFSSPLYTPFDSLSQWLLGNHLQTNRSYDSRLRVTGQSSVKQ